ncbi:related to protein carrier KAP123 [Cephalotrichum gorgonifer]|uniref:Related to protein carrier KAP123 n=1 Tax=Cephalotrichum gorgonifer TaxID=2041049 RepID=A0AAE8SRF0_9PEZI|nr:related to protein carrier KAP123 [Cephalotrichum gorgonifer]
MPNGPTRGHKGVATRFCRTSKAARPTNSVSFTMDKSKLIQLLEASQIPDTQNVKAVTAELQKNYFSQPESLLLLIEIAITHDNGGIRQLASVQAGRIAEKHWPSVPANQKGLAKQHLLEGVLKEPSAHARRSLSRLIAIIATTDLSDDEELLRHIITLNTKEDVVSREVGSYIVYSLLDNDPTRFTDHISQLFELFARTINDPQSKDVCVNTIKSIGALLIVIDPEDDEDSVKAIQALFPAMVRILKDAIDNENSEYYGDVFEVLQSFLAYEPALLNAHLKDLLDFMMEIAANTELEEDARSQAIAFLSQAVHARRMKIQGMKDVGARLMTTSLKIVTEMDDDLLDDDMDELTPVRSALTLIDQLSSDLPPRQVIVPLLDDFPKLAAHESPSFRKAAILSLGNAAEGSPDFISTQLAAILPIIVTLLNDSDEGVRHASLIGVIQLADEMADELAPKHDEIFAALLKNLEASTQGTNKGNVSIIRAVCGALNSLGVGSLDKDAAKVYGEKFLPSLGALLSHSDLSVKAAAAGAIGAIAASMGDNFTPYYKDVLTALAPYVSLTEGEEALALRSSVCDSMGSVAHAIGAELFQPYVMDLMKASEEALSIDNARLKETSFLLWGELSKIYGEHFKEFLPGVFSGLLETLELEEEEVSLDGLVEGASENDVLVVGGKKLKLKRGDDDDDNEAGDDSIIDMDEDDAWDDLEDFTGATAIALQQEVAIEVLGDVISESCNLDDIKSYLEPTLEKLMPLADHSFEGCRKAAVSTLWRTYTRVWKLMEKQPWKPGSPKSNPVPDPALAHIGGLVVKATLSGWPDEAERGVVTAINQYAAETLKLCGPAILGIEDFETQMVSTLASIITRSHPCQQDLGDEEDHDVEAGTSEFDWLVIDTAMDVVIGMAAAMGPAFAEHWNVFQKPIIKYASSQESLERSTATGAIAEIVRYLDGAVTPYTESLAKILLHRLSDNDVLTKSNAAFAIGQLIISSQDNNVLSLYEDVVVKLEPALSITDARMQDNIAGCFSRMMSRNPDPAIVAKLLPAVVNVLPLKEDFEENAPIFQCIYKLYDASNPTVQELTPRLVPVFKAVLSDPQEQLDDETRALVTKVVELLHQARPELFQ